MRTKLLYINEQNANGIYFEKQMQSSSTNSGMREKMKVIIGKAIINELTDIQRRCITDYYFNGKKEKEIAKELGLNISTVSRHISAARKKIRHIASYYL